MITPRLDAIIQMVLKIKTLLSEEKESLALNLSDDASVKKSLGPLEGNPPCFRVADIGTDHGYIPICLAKDNICTHVIASDINPMPLKAAQKNIAKYGCENIVDTRLGGGISVLNADEVDCAVIAGMGGELICSILRENSNIAKTIKYFVLQPMGAADQLRRYLYENGYVVADERLAMEKDASKFYTVFLVVSGIDDVPKGINLIIGKKLVENNDPILPKYIEFLLSRFKISLEGLKNSKNIHEHTDKITYYKNMIVQIENISQSESL